MNAYASNSNYCNLKIHGTTFTLRSTSPATRKHHKTSIEVATLGMKSTSHNTTTAKLCTICMYASTQHGNWKRGQKKEMESIHIIEC